MYENGDNPIRKSAAAQRSYEKIIAELTLKEDVLHGRA